MKCGSRKKPKKFAAGGYPADKPVQTYAKGGKVRGDGCASKGKTKGRMC